MSSKSINQNYNVSYRKYFYASNKKKSKNKKAFNYPKNKLYSEEIEYSPSKTQKENRFDNINNTGYPEITGTYIYYYIEREPRDEFNNFKTKWKTEICHYWEMYGECKYGNNCAFAHGDSELKQRKMTFNYKTKPCKQFFELGYCSYGSRCQFCHKKEDTKSQKDEKSDKVSYLKIIEELLSKENKISHELVKRPRLMTFENITHCSLEESENSKLKLYEDIINLKNEKSKNDKNVSVKLSDDTNSNSNISSDNGNDK